MLLLHFFLSKPPLFPLFLPPFSPFPFLFSIFSSPSFLSTFSDNLHPSLSSPFFLSFPPSLLFCPPSFSFLFPSFTLFFLPSFFSILLRPPSRSPSHPSLLPSIIPPC